MDKSFHHASTQLARYRRFHRFTAQQSINGPDRSLAFPKADNRGEVAPAPTLHGDTHNPLPDADRARLAYAASSILLAALALWDTSVRHVHGVLMRMSTADVVAGC